MKKGVAQTDSGSQISYDKETRKVTFEVTIEAVWELPKGLQFSIDREGKMGMIMALDALVNHGVKSHGLPNIGDMIPGIGDTWDSEIGLN